MKKIDFKQIKEIFKATRIKRATYVPLAVLSAASFANIINLDIIALAAVGILIYSIGGLYNAKKDNDFQIKKSYFNTSIFLILFTALLLSLINLKILALMSFAIFLALAYNTIGRKILYGDIFIASLTHIFIPFLGTLWILNFEITKYAPYALAPLFSFIFIVNVKNIINFNEDKKRNYSTLMTKFKNGKLLMIISASTGFFLILFFTLYFNLKLHFLALTLITFTFIFLIKNINSLEGKKATALARLIVVLIFFGYLLENQTTILITTLFIFSSYVFIKEGANAFFNLKFKNYS